MLQKNFLLPTLSTTNGYNKNIFGNKNIEKYFMKVLKHVVWFIVNPSTSRKKKNSIDLKVFIFLRKYLEENFPQEKNILKEFQKYLVKCFLNYPIKE